MSAVILSNIIIGPYFHDLTDFTFLIVYFTIVVVDENIGASLAVVIHIFVVAFSMTAEFVLPDITNF